MAIVEGVVAVEIVVIIVGSHPVVVVPVAVTIIPVVVKMWMMVCPTPTVREAIVVPTVTIVVRTVVVARPPPVVAHVNTYAPVVWIVVIPIQVGVERVVIAPSAIEVAMEATDAGGVIIVIIIIFVIIIIIGDVGIA